MVRVAVLVDKDTEEEYEKVVSLKHGVEWAQCILDDMENANWHTARSAFSPLIWLLPELYRALSANPALQTRLQHAVDQWDSEF